MFMDKVCATCGKQLQADQGFCDQCGAAWMPAPAPAVQGTSAYVAPQVAAPASGGSGKALVIVVILALIALGIGGWFFVTHRAVAATPQQAAVDSTKVTAPTATTQTTAATTSVVVDTMSSASSSVTGTAADAATEAAAASKQCSLITREEMGALLGSKIVKLTSNQLTCAYFTDAERSAQVDSTWVDGKAGMAEMKGFNKGEGLLTPVAGIGDEAYLQAAGVLHVLKGDMYVVVNSREYPNELVVESAIAKKIMEKVK
jgi:hypothetical protein